MEVQAFNVNKDDFSAPSILFPSGSRGVLVAGKLQLEVHSWPGLTRLSRSLIAHHKQPRQTQTFVEDFWLG